MMERPKIEDLYFQDKISKLVRELDYQFSDNYPLLNISVGCQYIGRDKDEKGMPKGLPKIKRFLTLNDNKNRLEVEFSFETQLTGLEFERYTVYVTLAKHRKAWLGNTLSLDRYSFDMSEDDYSWAKNFLNTLITEALNEWESA